MQKVYLDNNVTTMLDPQALEEMMPFMNEFYGNPNSLHDFGTSTHKAIRLAIDRLYAIAKR